MSISYQRPNGRVRQRRTAKTSRGVVGLVAFLCLGPMRALVDGVSVALAVPLPSMLQIGMVPGLISLMQMMYVRRKRLLPIYSTAAITLAVTIAMVTVGMNELNGYLPSDFEGRGHLAFNLVPLAWVVVFYFNGCMSCDSHYLVLVSLMSALLLSLFVLVVAIQSGGFQFTTATDDGIYLFLADAIALTGLIGLGRFSIWLTRAGVALALGIVLLITGSRSGFFLFLVSAGVALWPRGVLARLALLAGAVTIGLIGFAALSMNDIAFLQQFRVLRVLFAEVTDGSLAARSMIMQLRWDALSHNLVFGDYWGQVLQTRSAGSYMHNILSWWEQFGIVCFGLIAFALLAACREVFGYLTEGRADNRNRCMAAACIYALLSMLLTRSYVSSLLWYPVGLFFTMRVGEIEFRSSRHASR